MSPGVPVLSTLVPEILMTAPAPLAIQPTLDTPETLQLDAASLSEHLPGPGLAGRTVVHVVVSVTRADGMALTDLPAKAFTLRGVAGSIAGHAIAIAGVRETAPGIYTLSLAPTSRASSHGPTILAVLVRDRNTDRAGRRLVRIDP